jgi:hypothetical protein
MGKARFRAKAIPNPLPKPGEDGKAEAQANENFTATWRNIWLKMT